MKKLILSIFFIFILLSSLYSKKILVIIIESVKNYTIKSYYYDFTEIDYPYFLTLECKNYEIPASYDLDDIVRFLMQRVGMISSTSEVRNFSTNDKIYFKTKIVIDSEYKVLEKGGKKYYIFNICYPNKKQKNIFLKLIQDFFNG